MPHSIRQTLAHVLSEPELNEYLPLIEKINLIKKQKNAVILAHNYMSPEIFHGVADIVGDSLKLAKEAAQAHESEIILMCGVYFMAETAKILNPTKKVLIPDLEAGCSLASSITGADVRNLRIQYPHIPIVGYVNTSAEVKAELDVCCTSGNALEVIESLQVPTVIFVPDRFLAYNVAQRTKVKIIPWESGSCEVHEKFSGNEIKNYKNTFSNLTVIAHPECPPDVLDASDFSGSTAQMIQYVKEQRPERVLLVTECSMSDNLSAECPEISFVRPCNLCPHMKKINLKKILNTLETETPAVFIDSDVMDRARRSLDRMMNVRMITAPC